MLSDPTVQQRKSTACAVFSRGTPPRARVHLALQQNQKAVSCLLPTVCPLISKSVFSYGFLYPECIYFPSLKCHWPSQSELWLPLLIHSALPLTPEPSPSPSHHQPQDWPSVIPHDHPHHHPTGLWHRPCVDTTSAPSWGSFHLCSPVLEKAISSSCR